MLSPLGLNRFLKRVFKMNEITDRKVYTNSDKTLTLTISEDNLSAYLTIEDNSNMIDEEEISSLISSAGIKNRLEAAINFNIKNEIIKKLGKPFLIAIASVKKVENGISYTFDSESCININERYEIDALSKFVKVEKDQPLAEMYIPDTHKAGIDIFSNEVSSEQESQIDVENILGNNVYYSAETNQILSSEAGYPYFDHDNKICVKSTFISQDILDTTKTIYGNTIIDGIISNSNLEIFGDLWVKGSIRSCNNVGIIVHGDIIINYVEDSRIVASGEITINKKARNSLVLANGTIKAEEFSSISGGVIQSGKSIEVYSTGNDHGVVTEVEIAIAPFIKEQIRIVQNKLTNTKNNSDEDNVLISSFIEELEKLHSKFEDEIEKSYNAGSLRISIEGKVYPNSNIRILKDILEISEEKCSIEISVNDSGLEINEVDKL